ncbi:MAG TPA: YfiR family protein [Patescibacteria group bacterium]|jgi:hypothetical protein|nr:YfiR family protein [Patescibacteria group bacterium]
MANPPSHAQEFRPSEYQVKAAFLFNFAKFVQWPPQAFSSKTSPLVIGVLGENPFHDDLARAIRDKTVDEHPVIMKELRSPTQATNCHILFISSSEKQQLPEIFKTLKKTNVLTVGETEGFARSGGMINFVLEGTKVRFEINKDATVGAGLKISSKLMSLALPPSG